MTTLLFSLIPFITMVMYASVTAMVLFKVDLPKKTASHVNTLPDYCNKHIDLIRYAIAYLHISTAST